MGMRIYVETCTAMVTMLAFMVLALSYVSYGATTVAPSMQMYQVGGYAAPSRVVPQVTTLTTATTTVQTTTIVTTVPPQGAVAATQGQKLTATAKTPSEVSNPPFWAVVGSLGIAGANMFRLRKKLGAKQGSSRG